jgi:hypothetical protein
MSGVNEGANKSIEQTSSMAHKKGVSFNHPQYQIPQAAKSTMSNRAGINSSSRYHNLPPVGLDSKILQQQLIPVNAFTQQSVLSVQ